jgi:uncharacterized protein YbaR (Trm112 family)
LDEPSTAPTTEELIMEKRYLNILVCPNCKGSLTLDESANELICELDQLAYPIREGIPVMLIEEARQIKAAV